MSAVTQGTVPPAPTSAGLAPPAPVFSWRHALLAIALVEIAFVSLYHDTAWAMVAIWARSETFNHAFLVPPIVLWLIWERRAALARSLPRPAPRLTVPLAGLAFAWLLGELAAVNAVTQLAFVAMMVLAVPLVIGLRAARLIAFPLGFLFFAVPIGEFVMPMLMEWTATFTVFGLRASGIPVYQEGLHFVIPSGRWSVVEACSGVRYLIASITIGTLYAYLNYRSLKRRMIFVGISILVPLLANWLRAYMIVMLGHLSNNTIATGVDHLIYGWIFFGVVIMLMFAIGIRWREDEKDHFQEAVKVGAGSLEFAKSTEFIIAALMAIAILIAPRVALLVLNQQTSLHSPVLDAQSLVVNGWKIDDEAQKDWIPAFANPTATMNATLYKDDHRVGVFIAWYRNQGFDRKLISSENVLVKNSDTTWALSGRGMRQTRVGGQEITVRNGQLRSGSLSLGGEPLRLRVWHWYWIGGRFTTSDHLGKLWLALDRLVGHGDDSAAVFIHAPEDQPGGAEAALSVWLEESGDTLVTMLEQASASAKR